MPSTKDKVLEPPKENLLFEPNERFSVDSASPVPLYHQMEKVILDRIADKNSVGKMLPAETDLMTMFGVSRATARKTYENLVSKGLIERRRALGTRVIGHQITEDLGRLKSYTEEMKLRGVQVSTKVLDAGLHLAEARVRQELALADGAQTLRLRRLRGTSEFFPIVLLVSEIPASLGIDPGEDFSSSLYRLIEEKYRIPIEWAEEEIRVAKATPEEAKLLRLQPGDGVLVMERVTYTREDRPIEFVRGVYHPDHYTYSIRLKR